MKKWKSGFRNSKHTPTKRSSCWKFFENFGFGIDFVGWIKKILKNQESCIINLGKISNKKNSN